MNLQPSFTDIRSDMAYQFSTLRVRAVRESLWAKISGKNTKLAVFPEDAPAKSPNRRFMGLQEIPVGDIVGTLSRQNDFDRKFRPLNTYLRDRWVNTYVTLEREGWSPILVHKVEEQFYVEDGHHRVSVAQALGLAFIQAKVWEYPCLVKEAKRCQPAPCPEISSVKAYARVTEYLSLGSTKIPQSVSNSEGFSCVSEPGQVFTWVCAEWKYDF